MQNFADKDALTSALSTIKHMTMLYNDCASQTDDPQLAKDLCTLIAEEHQARIQVYNIMNQNGWYNPQPIDEQQLRQAQQKCSQTAQTLGGQSQTGFGMQTAGAQWGGSQAGGQIGGQTGSQTGNQDTNQWGRQYS